MSLAYSARFVPVCDKCARASGLVSPMFTFSKKEYVEGAWLFEKRESEVSSYLRDIRLFVLARVASDVDGGRWHCVPVSDPL